MSDLARQAAKLEEEAGRLLEKSNTGNATAAAIARAEARAHALATLALSLRVGSLVALGSGDHGIQVVAL